jgi:ClpP class serine protease
MRRRYDKQGILALYPQAFMDLFIEVEDADNEQLGDVTVVAIRGPLEHHDGWWADSYEAIVDRVAAACTGSASTIILKIDSPGGELLGCFDAARTIRARCAAANKRLVAYVEGCACSAAYALACAADKIITSDTAFTGSIGILITRIDVTARDTQMGAAYTLVASGSRKLDGNPHAALSAAELAATQSQCDSLAALFFELVASLRGVDAEAIAGLEAGIFHGAEAVARGLADRVMTFDELLAAIASGEGDPMADDKEEKKETEAAADDDAPKASKEVDDARALLEKAAEGDGEEAERAKKALEVLDGGPGEEDDEEDDDESASSSASKSGGQTTARRGTARVSADSAADLAKSVTALSEKVDRLEREKDEAKRSAMLATRPDLGKELVAHLSTMPFAEAKAIVDRMPKPAALKPAATATVPGTRGKGQEARADDAPPPDAATAALDRGFGKEDGVKGVRREGTSLVFGLRAPAAPKPAAPADAGKGSAA